MNRKITLVMDQGRASKDVLLFLLDREVPFEIHHSKDYREHREFPILYVGNEKLQGYREAFDFLMECLPDPTVKKG